ncbi:hypothetical protein J3R82DRAFT_7939 [Butyriboletus roseoflavus]|nr:hypothetical protein J3R82DRAFT_7939 [Butyriboletus roseoflavus]
MDGITDTFNLIVQKGIEGGFAPSTAKARYLITRAPKSSNFIISTHIRPDGTPDLLPVVSRELKVADYVKSITRLQTVLRDLPVQHIGAEDLYGRNTSIVHVTDPRKLADLHIKGSEAGRGIPQPTEEQKVLFDEAVRIIEKWGDPQGPSE